jgi:hypothetical protein
MLGWSNTSPTGANQAVSVASAYQNATQPTSHYLFCATAQDLLNNSGSINSPTYASQRTATTCYMRGLNEHLRIQTSSAIPWFHRRICFTHRGVSPFQVNNPKDSPGFPFGTSVDTSNGMQRAWFNAAINLMDNTVADRVDLLFKGVANKDWNDYILAPVDNTRVDIKFDKTWIIKSANQSGALIERKLWHPMNSNLVYNDDESGEGITTSYYSAATKSGMGDYYVLDMFQPGLGGGANDIINIYSNSTLYWHEK